MSLSTKTLNTRVIQKHDTAENWAKAVSFIPKKGEIIIYDADSNNPQPRIKIGNGTTTVVNLPFCNKQITDELATLRTDKHTHDNKSVLDGITSALVTTWNNAYSHISDTIKHITSTERTNWNNAYTHSNSYHAPVNANETVKQTNTTENTNLPILISDSGSRPSGNTGNTKYSNGVTVNPSTKTVNASSFNADSFISVGDAAVITYDSENERLVFSFK